MKIPPSHSNIELPFSSISFHDLSQYRWYIRNDPKEERSSRSRILAFARLSSPQSPSIRPIPSKFPPYKFHLHILGPSISIHLSAQYNSPKGEKNAKCAERGGRRRNGWTLFLGEYFCGEMEENGLRRRTPTKRRENGKFGWGLTRTPHSIHIFFINFGWIQFKNSVKCFLDMKLSPFLMCKLVPPAHSMESARGPVMACSRMAKPSGDKSYKWLTAPT